jgi:hypothetical protein
MQTNYTLTTKINEAYLLLNRHSIYFYAKKGITIVLEIVFFALALGFLIGIFSIGDEFVVATFELNDDVIVKEVAKSKFITAGLFVLKMAAVLFALLFVCIALLFGYIRRKDNRIRKAALLLENVLTATPQNP